jgi:hypothetical protein
MDVYSAEKQMAKIINELGMSAQDFAETLRAFNQLVSEANAKTANPNQKSDLEIFSQIEISDEFRNFINNSN